MLVAQVRQQLAGVDKAITMAAIRTGSTRFRRLSTMEFYDMGLMGSASPQLATVVWRSEEDYGEEGLIEEPTRTVCVTRWRSTYAYRQGKWVSIADHIIDLHYERRR